MQTTQIEMSPEYITRCDKLLKRAHNGQWDPDERLDWKREMTLDQVTVDSPLISERLAAAWPSMDDAQRAEAVRTLLGTLLANLAVGEVFVDECLDDLKTSFPHDKLKEILAMQLIDEDRHASVLDRYVFEKLNYSQVEKSEAAAAALAKASAPARERWESAALLVMVLEIAATAAIQGMRTYCDEPLLQGMLKGIIGDESRHISGLTLSLRAYSHTWDEETRELLKEAAVLGWVQGLAVTERPACDMSDRLDATYATAPESPTENWPFFRKTLADILLPKLKILGLLDEDLANRMREAGCPVPAINKAAALA